MGSESAGGPGGGTTTEVGAVVPRVAIEALCDLRVVGHCDSGPLGREVQGGELDEVLKLRGTNKNVN